MRGNGKRNTALIKRSGLNKRILSLFLAVAMLFSSTELTAFATEPGVGVETVETPDTPEQSEEKQEEGAETPDTPEEGTETPETAEEGEETPGDSDETAGEDDENVGESDETPGEDDENEGEPEETPGEEDADDTAGEEPEIAEENAVVQVMQDDLQIEAGNGLGSLLMSDLQIAAQAEKDESAESYAVSDIEVSGTTARVMFHAAGSCTAVVAIYEEGSEKPYAFGNAVVPDGENQVIVEIETDSMPTYFVVKGYLVDTDSLRPLSEEYFSNMYTRAFQDFLKKTTDDFDQDKVVNLDEDKTTNFAVIKTGNSLIKPVEDSNSGIINELISYDETTNTYTFANVDESIKNLAAEDIFIYQRDESDIVIIKIYSITQRETDDEENVIDIKAYTDELEVDDVFEYVKIEEETGTYEAEEVDASSCPAGVSYLGRNTAAGYAVSGNPSVSMDVWELDLDDDSFKDEVKYGPVSGTVEGNIEAGLSVTVTLEYYFGWGIYDVDINITADISGSGDIKLEGKLSVPLGSAVEVKNKLITVKYVPTFVIEVYFEGKFSVGTETTFGITISNQEKSGLHAESTLKVLELSAEFGGYVGFDFEPEIDVKNILHAGLETGVHRGLELSNKGGLTDSVSTKEETERHECGNECFSGEIYAKVPFGGELKILKFKEYDLEEKLNLDGDLIKRKLGEFYYSCKYNEPGKGECPHKEYKTTVLVKTSAGKPIKGAAITYEDGQQQECTATTGKEGQASIWLHAGQQTVSASCGGVTKSQTVPVDGAKQVSFVLDVELEGEVERIYAGYSITAAITKDGSLYTWGNNSSGQVGSGPTNTPRCTPIKILDNVESVSLGESHSGAVTKDGSLYIWGSASYGMLGDGRE